MKQFATTSYSNISNFSPLGLTNFIEKNVDPEWADALRRSGQWNDVKNCKNINEIKSKALSIAKTIPFFEGKSDEEIEAYTNEMGKNYGFLES